MWISSYATIKEFIVSVIHLSKDAIHIYLGLFCLIASLVLLRKPLSSYWVLLAGLILSCVMEILDLRFNHSIGARLSWAASFHDLVNTNLMPLLLVVLARWRWIKG